MRWLRILMACGVVSALLAAPEAAGAGRTAPRVIGNRGHAAPPVRRQPQPGPNLVIDAGKTGRPISPLIYGVNFGSTQLLKSLGATVSRWGGNTTSRYNWHTGFWNLGSDWFFENVRPSSQADAFVDARTGAGADTVLTLPMLGWVSKDSPRQHPFACGFKVSVYGQQQHKDPFDTNCGNGVRPNGHKVTGNDPKDTSIAITPEFDRQWVRHLVAKHGSASHGGVRFYELDNEPALWNSTHRDVHPKPLTYQELASRSIAYAAAVKAADPHALVLGPSDWGWCAYFFSAADPGGCSDGPDRRSHGNVPIVPWYLQQMRAYQQAHGRRLLDYLDLHFYPQADGVSLSPAGSKATQALRLRQTRTLWDPHYHDESWTSDLGLGPVMLVPRMRKWVAQNLPGTKLAITEYNWGATNSLNGALAEADVLGIFGREGVGLATMWEPPAATDPAAFAFRAFRDYDGHGAKFGDVSVGASSADQGKLAVYAARRTSDGDLTLVVINKSGSDLRSAVSLPGADPSGHASVYTYSTANLLALVHQPDQIVTASGFTRTFPRSSITVLAIPT
ncbi:MAG TPA: glycoside hydrolase family 44 protein [Actinomycetota bacterium]|nr:glycoside hydrolase family 44 protein [Actinomycetota bacterium]